MEISLQEQDKKHLEKFNKSLESTYKIMKRTTKLNGKIFNNYRVRISNTQLANQLEKMGCINNKSLILSFPPYEIVPQSLIRHFVRGYVDGDGWIGLSTDNTLARIEICGTYDFLRDIQIKMGWRGTSIREDKRSNVFVLEYGGIYVQEYLHDLYKDSKIYLDRKFEKYKNIIAVLNRNI